MSAPDPVSPRPEGDAGALTLRVVNGLKEVDRAAWDALANPDPATFNPFVSWDFLEALEASGCVSAHTGWLARHVVVEDASGALAGAAPAYVKGHSQGEYVFDHSWAHAYENAGGRYYPKLQVASPFTPVTGPRLLSPDPRVRAALRQGLVEVGSRLGVSSLHVTFSGEDEWTEAADDGFLQRQDQQFHWENRGYASFDAFLADLASRKRKGLKKERAAAQDGVVIERLSGEALTEDHWDAFYACYLDTGARKWGSPYLNREAFALIHERMADDVVMVLAFDDGLPVAAALNFVGGDALYGRYWGRLTDKPFLHFEVCYYQAIDEAIARGLSRVEAGAQGEHKVARGYAPQKVYSYHWIYDANFRAAVDDYLTRERAAVDADIEFLGACTPFKKSD